MVSQNRYHLDENCQLTGSTSTSSRLSNHNIHMDINSLHIPISTVAGPQQAYTGQRGCLVIERSALPPCAKLTLEMLNCFMKTLETKEFFFQFEIIINVLVSSF